MIKKKELAESLVIARLSGKNLFVRIRKSTIKRKTIYRPLYRVISINDDHSVLVSKNIEVGNKRICISRIKKYFIY